MFKQVIISTLFATLAFPVRAEPLKDYDLSVLPADVAARVVELQKHGERFEPAIRAIFEAASNPTWGFDDCGHDAADVAAKMPHSCVWSVVGVIYYRSLGGINIGGLSRFRH